MNGTAIGRNTQAGADIAQQNNVAIGSGAIAATTVGGGNYVEYSNTVIGRPRRLSVGRMIRL